MPETDKTISIIESTVEAAGLTDATESTESTETTEVEPAVETTDDTVVETKTTDDKVVDAKTDDKKVEKVEDPKQDEVDKLLEAEGFKAGPGGRENRIPYPRTKKIIGNALKKRDTAYQETLSAKDTEITGYRQVLDTHKRADQLFATDPDRAIQMLAAMHPGKYDKFLKGGVADKPAERTTDKPVETDKPKPDIKFDDGTVGYSPEQHDKLLEWNTSRAVAKAVAETRAEYDKRFGPIEQGYKDSAAQNQFLQGVRGIIAEAKEDYGEAFYKEHEPAILDAIKANDKAVDEGRAQKVPLRRIIDKVLRSKSRVDEDRTRSKVMDEINQRAKASEKVETRSTKQVRDPNETRDTEDIIREAVAAVGLK